MDYRSYILCGLLAFGLIATAVSQPAADDRENKNDDIQNDKSSDDYDYEDQGKPADQVKSTASSPKSTMLPYFDYKIVRRTVKPNGNITLECPVKNLSDSNVILWFKEENTITNDLSALSNTYEVAKQNFSLIIKNATESFAGNYYCEIAPQKIRMQTILKVSNETESVSSTAIPTPPELPQVKEAAKAPESNSASLQTTSRFSLVAMVSIFAINLLSHRKCFQLLLNF